MSRWLKEVDGTGWQDFFYIFIVTLASQSGHSGGWTQDEVISFSKYQKVIIMIENNHP